MKKFLSWLLIAAMALSMVTFASADGAVKVKSVRRLPAEEPAAEEAPAEEAAAEEAPAEEPAEEQASE